MRSSLKARLIATFLGLLLVVQLAKLGITAVADERLAAMCALYKDRCSTTVELAAWVAMYFAPVEPSAEDLATHVTDAVRPALAALRERLSGDDFFKQYYRLNRPVIITPKGTRLCRPPELVLDILPTP